MIILKTASETLQVVLGSVITTNQLDCFASFRNRTASTYIGDSNLLLTNDTTAVNLVGSPASGSQNVIDFISVFNKDTTNKVVTIQIFNGSSSFVLHRVTLASGEKLEYNEGDGFYVIATSGAKKLSINQGNNTITSGISSVVLGADVVNNNVTANTMQDVTGLSFPVLNNKTYWFKFVIPYASAATTTGSRWGVNASAGLATTLSLISEYSLTTTTTTRNALIQAFDSPAASNATSASLLNNLAIIEGYFKPTADGTLIARFASEVSASAITAKSGAVVYYQQLD